MKKIIFISILLFQQALFAQNEWNIWYFGEYAGIDFNDSIPVALTDGALKTWEGSASICDTSGSLLFYTEGTTIWNSNHTIMPNGFFLTGDISTTQSATIVKKPGENSIYFVFTVDDQAGSYGFRYSEVDMSLEGGLGDVNENKNIHIVTPTCEKATVIKHSSDTSYWIITHLYNSNTFHAYSLTSAGLNMTPVVSNIGTIVTGPYYSAGYIKASSDGKKIALANTSYDNAELFDFNDSTGILSNVITFSNFIHPGAYGIEFSPNNNLLYISEIGVHNSNIYQYNLLAGSPQAIISSRTTIASIDEVGGAIQLAPDNKIYCARIYEDYLGVIQNPNALGDSCNYTLDGFFLEGSTSNLGLPSSYKSIIYKPIIIVEEELIILELPNVFTPNEDGINDLFVPIISEGIGSMKTIIYNRWGQKVFETKNLNIEWDGHDVSDGTYFWTIQYTSINGVENKLSGYVTLLK